MSVVTGSASGIGAAVCRGLELQGDRVVGIDLHDAEVVADLSNPKGRLEAVDAVIAAASPGGPDRIVLCAGLGTHAPDPGLIAAVNYFGCVELLDGLFPQLVGKPGASVVVVSSNSAQLTDFNGHPYVEALLAGDEKKAMELARGDNGFIAYAGSKHAVARAVRLRSQQFGEVGVRLNAVAPGATETPLLEGVRADPTWGAALESVPIPLGRPARPQEIADVILFLLSEGAAQIHGSIVYVDGGSDAVMRPSGGF